jgi:hypothetical protein
MKTVTFSMQLPDWAHWKATDSNGSVWICDNEPHLDESIGRWMPGAGHYQKLINFEMYIQNWRETKARIA